MQEILYKPARPHYCRPTTDYDTFAADALAAGEVATVLFRIKGDQVAPR